MRERESWLTPHRSDSGSVTRLGLGSLGLEPNGGGSDKFASVYIRQPRLLADAYRRRGTGRPTTLPGSVITIRYRECDLRASEAMVALLRHWSCMEAPETVHCSNHSAKSSLTISEDWFLASAS